MEIKIENSQISEIKIKGEVFKLKNVSLSHLKELEAHAKWLEDHIEISSDWSKEDVFEFMADSTENQKNMIRLLLNSKKPTYTSEILNKLGLNMKKSKKPSTAIAGITAGFTRRIKRDFKHKIDNPIVFVEWDNSEWACKYWLNPDCIDYLNEYFKESGWKK